MICSPPSPLAKYTGNIAQTVQQQLLVRVRIFYGAWLSAGQRTTPARTPINYEATADSWSNCDMKPLPFHSLSLFYLREWFLSPW